MMLRQQHEVHILEELQTALDIVQKALKESQKRVENNESSVKPHDVLFVVAAQFIELHTNRIRNEKDSEHVMRGAKQE